MLKSNGILRIFIFIPITYDTSIRGKVKNNEDSRNMHILKIIPTMHNVCIFHSREKYDPLKSWTLFFTIF